MGELEGHLNFLYYILGTKKQALRIPSYIFGKESSCWLKDQGSSTDSHHLIFPRESGVIIFVRTSQFSELPVILC